MGKGDAFVKYLMGITLYLHHHYLVLVGFGLSIVGNGKSPSLMQWVDLVARSAGLTLPRTWTDFCIMDQHHHFFPTT